MTWRERARCRRSGELGTKVDRFTGERRKLNDKEWNELQNRMFFPVDTTNSQWVKKQKEETRAFCGLCPVRQECLEAALPDVAPSKIEDAYLVGMWGVMDLRQRRAYRRKL